MSHAKTVWGILLALMVMMAAGARVQAAATWGELSLGKFYTTNVQPSTSYPDRWPNQYTSGAKLTDELIGDSSMDNWVGWYGSNVVVTVDLGQTYSVSDIELGAQSRTSWGIYFPTGLVISTSTDGTNFTQYGSVVSFPANTSTFSRTTVAGNGGWVSARYVRYTAQGTAQWIFLDELQIYGSIPNAPKYVPTDGCFQGAYPVTPQGYLDIEGFENMAQKSLQMVLWYANWESSFEDNIGWVIDKKLEDRYIQVGFLPYNTTAASIAAGSHDTFLRDWFTDCAAAEHPVWIRAMNEMNGSWTFENSSGYLKYGGDPQSFRWAWRRMVNIAQQVGADGNQQIFVWSPNSPSYPDQTWNQMENYYPGDQYVDWVGVSAYNFSGTSGASLEELLQEVYSKYSVNKPIMISEGGASAFTQQEEWIAGWFTSLRQTYPQVKAAVWFNAVDGSYNIRIDSSADGLYAYQSYVRGDYFIGCGKGYNTGLTKSYTLSPSPSSPYVDSGTLLTDGSLPTQSGSYFETTHVGWAGLNSTPLEVVLDLGANAYHLTRFAVSTYRMDSSGIYLPAGGSVQVSTDGTNFTMAGAMSFEPSDTSDTDRAYELVCTSDVPLTARYVKYTVNTTASSGWTMICEVRAYDDIEPDDRPLLGEGL